MCATFNGTPSTIIVSWYSPTNSSDLKDIPTFYKELSSLVQHIIKHSVLITNGDKCSCGQMQKLQILFTQLSRQSFLSRKGLCAKKLNFQKGKENLGPTLTQINQLHS